MMVNTLGTKIYRITPYLSTKLCVLLAINSFISEVNDFSNGRCDLIITD